MLKRALLQADSTPTSPTPREANPGTQRPPPPPPPSAHPKVAAAAVTAVTTAAELQSASIDQRQDIEIQAHLDLRSLDRLPNLVQHMEATERELVVDALFVAHRSMRSMRVRPPAPPTPALYVRVCIHTSYGPVVGGHDKS